MTEATAKGMRTCIGCGQVRPKGDMMRIVRTSSDAIRVDATGRAAGRGAYICSRACLRTALDKRKLSRALKREVKDDEASRIASELEQTPWGVAAR